MPRLHLGCGGQVFGTPGLREHEKDWINVDLGIGERPYEDPLKRELIGTPPICFPRLVEMDIATLPMIPDDFASEIHTDHALEHLSMHQVYVALRTWHRVLTPGGLVRIIVPDLLAIARQLIETDGDLLWSRRGELTGDRDAGYTKLIVGIYGEDWSGPYAFHKTGFTPKYMRWCLEQAAFRDIRIESVWNHEIFSIEATAFK